jgi:glycerophosphoryl diester phosphodiesterase
VNDVKEAERLVGLDVDGIITDYPDSMLFLRTL